MRLRCACEARRGAVAVSSSDGGFSSWGSVFHYSPKVSHSFTSPFTPLALDTLPDGLLANAPALLPAGVPVDVRAFKL